MYPTMKLRWVKREAPAWNGMIGGPPCTKIIEVLQQWWEGQEYGTSDTLHYVGEWRDVPIETD